MEQKEEKTTLEHQSICILFFVLDSSRFGRVKGRDYEKSAAFSVSFELVLRLGEFKLFL